MDATLAMPAIHVWLRGADLDADPGRCALVVEYALWEAQVDDWRARRPVKNGGLRQVGRAWLAEGQALFIALTQ